MNIWRSKNSARRCGTLAFLEVLSPALRIITFSVSHAWKMFSSSENCRKKGSKRISFSLPVAEHTSQSHRLPNIPLQFDIAVSEQPDRLPPVRLDRSRQSSSKIRKNNSTEPSQNKKPKTHARTPIMDHVGALESPSGTAESQYPILSTKINDEGDGGFELLSLGDYDLEINDGNDWEDEKALYWECCLAEDGLIHLDRSTFIIQDWDCKLQMLKVWKS